MNLIFFEMENNELIKGKFISKKRPPKKWRAE